MPRMNAIFGITVADLSRTPAIRDGRILPKSKPFLAVAEVTQIQREGLFPQIDADKISAKIVRGCGMPFAARFKPYKPSNCHNTAESGGSAPVICEMLSIRSEFNVIQNGLRVDRSPCKAARNEIKPVQSEVRVNQNEVTVIQRTPEVDQNRIQPVQSGSNAVRSRLDVIRSKLRCQFCQSQFKLCHEEVVRNEVQAVQPCRGFET